jgi:uncharacterized cofD-like protein
MTVEKAATRPGGAAAFPHRIVALGGGTGLPGVLRGLRPLVTHGDKTALTAVVTMTDDGGSSGRLRKSMGLPPPGDVRNCLVALAEEEDLLAGLFQHRYGECRELNGHSVGNLILAALAEQTGSFLKAVEVSSEVLRTAGQILPSTQDDVWLEAVLEDGTRVAGETRIAERDQRVRRISVRPADARPTPGVLEAIAAADLIVLGPGSLYTSLIPNIVIQGIADALFESDAPVVLVANLVSERGEAAGLDLVDHLEVIEEHAGRSIIDAVLVNAGTTDAAVLDRYRDEGASPLYWPDRGPRRPLIERRDLLARTHKLRHDPAATVEGLISIWSRFAAKARTIRKA